MRKRIHKVCIVINWAAFLYLILFFLIALLAGEDALNGKVENGHFYLGRGERGTEVPYIVFMLSELYVTGLPIMFAIAVLTYLVDWVTGGWKEPLSLVTNEINQPPNGPLLSAFHKIGLLFWRGCDLIASITWVLFDSWRKPNVEFFTRLSREECIIGLSAAIHCEPSLYHIDRPVVGLVGGTHFCLTKHFYPIERPRWRFRPAQTLVLVGKLSPTKHGTYVRGWHRFASMSILQLTLYSGLALSVLSVPLAYHLDLASVELAGGLGANAALYVVIPPLVVAFLFLWLWIGVLEGRARHSDLATLLQLVLKDESTGSDDRVHPFPLHHLLDHSSGPGGYNTCRV